MIIDSLKNAKKYYSVHPRLEKAFKFLHENDLSAMPEGKYSIDGTDVHANVMVRPAVDKASAKFEAHDNYMDIQVVVANTENFGWSDRADCVKIKEAYNADKDVVFFADTPQMYFGLQPGQFVVFFPEDAHAPLIGSGDVKKIVVKVKM